MASNIKGITIELDGDTTGLQKALSDVDKASKNLASELKQVERALKFDPGNLELIGQKQELLSQQVDHTTTRLNRLKAAQKQVEEQFQRGDIGADKYRAFQREIITTENKLGHLRSEMSKLDDVASGGKTAAELQRMGDAAEKTNDKVHQLAEGLEDLEGFASSAGDALSKTFETALDSASTLTNIEISFDVPKASIASVKEAIKQVEAYGVDAESALEGVRRQWALNKNASDSANAAIVKGVASLTRAYAGLDFSEVIQEINEIGKEIGVTDKEALAMANTLLKIGFPPDQLDIISEYGGQLKRMGFEVEQIQAMFAAGIDTGSWNIDNLFDGLKEARIRLAEFGQEVPKALKPLLKNAGISEQQMQRWGQAVAKGGKDGSKAMVDVANALSEVKNETLRNALGVQVFGTMWEDQGDKLLTVTKGAEGATKSLSQSQKELSEQMSKLDADPMVQLSKAMSDLKTALTPVLSVVAQVVAAFADWMSNNSVLAATIVGIGTVITVLVGALGALSPIFIALTAAATFFGTSLGVISAIVAAVIAAISGLIFIGVAIAQNWDSVSASLVDGWNWLKEQAASIFNGLIQFFIEVGMTLGKGMIDAWNQTVNDLTAIWETVRNVASTAWQGVTNTIQGAMQSARSGLTTGWTAIKSTVSGIWNSLKSTASTTWNGIKSTIASVINGIRSSVTSSFNSIRSTITSIWNSIRSAAASAWAGIRSTISSGIASAYNAVTGYVGRFRTAGSALLSALADGIRSGISKAVSAVSSGMAKIRAYLPFSPAKVGPLSDLDKSGESFFPTFASKMNQGVQPMLRAISDGLRQASVTTTQAIEAPTLETPTIQMMDSGRAVGNTVNVYLDGNIFLDNDYRVRELGTVISQSLQRDATITRRAQGVRVYAPR